MDNLQKHLENLLNERIKIFPYSSGKLQTQSGAEYFLKTGAPSATYQCEADGLGELARSGAISVAEVAAAGKNYILTKYIESGSKRTDFFEDFGRRLARMHRQTAPHFGFYENNFIGANRQINLAEGDEKVNWVTFYFNKRLLYQYKLAESNNLVSDRLRKGFSKLETTIEKILANSQEPPALLHGDLWAGNYLCNSQGNPVLIDPAVYYGHREADLAMTKLFGGFTQSFYRAYNQEYPLPEGWEYREDVYKLYHVLNHLNIFGRSYLSEAEYLAGKWGN